METMYGDREKCRRGATRTPNTIGIQLPPTFWGIPGTKPIISFENSP